MSRQSPKPLSIKGILAWADAHHRRTGKWPREHSGPVSASPGETWRKVDLALRNGNRGLAGGSTLALLLFRKRGVRYQRALPRLTIKQVLVWADAYHAKTGRWPTARSGPVDGVPGETWSKIHGSLRFGRCGLPGKSSLARLLARERGARNHKILPRLTVRQILAWADAHRARTGRWPMDTGGLVSDAPGETWNNVNVALRVGFRGLPGGSSLILLLAERRGTGRGDFTERQILAWADEYRKRTGQWPITTSGPILETSWCAVDRALRQGIRGLRGGSSLSAFLAKHRGYRPLRPGRPPGARSRRKLAAMHGRLRKETKREL